MGTWHVGRCTPHLSRRQPIHFWEEWLSRTRPRWPCLLTFTGELKVWILWLTFLHLSISKWFLFFFQNIMAANNEILLAAPGQMFYRFDFRTSRHYPRGLRFITVQFGHDPNGGFLSLSDCCHTLCMDIIVPWLCNVLDRFLRAHNCLLTFNNSPEIWQS